MQNGKKSVEELCIQTIRTLCMDMVQKARSGHPGTPMALAPAAFLLWTRFLRHNPGNPSWIDRDRFVLSCGHASALIYALLYCCGYDLSLEELRRFRQWGSRTPGHPEVGLTPGVETSTGPLGQGLQNAVGMAMAEAHLRSIYNQPGQEIVDHRTYVLCSDGDLMEGASHEAASLAGHLGLHKLIVVYDDNHITIEGDTALSCSDDVVKRFEAYHWHVQNIGDRANDLQAISDALRKAQEEKRRPSLIVVRSHIAYGSPNRQDTKEAHGEPLGEEEIRLTKKFYGWPESENFLVPDEVVAYMKQNRERGQKLEEEWNRKMDVYQSAHMILSQQFRQAWAQDLPVGWDQEIPVFTPSMGSMATRVASGKILNAIYHQVPNLIGGSADLAPSTKTKLLTSETFSKEHYSAHNLAFGIREHAMVGSCSGMALHGGMRPFASTFFVFSDYARPAIRLAAMMKLPVIYLMTHDSIGVGEDGPTHQPVEQLASFRAMPNLVVIRPADANETAVAWRVAMERKDGPTMLVLSRQDLAVLDRDRVASADGLRRGAYVLCPERGKKPEVILIASGSEVHLVKAAWEKLHAEQVDARVVSMPSFELFRNQPADYQDEVIPKKVFARLAVEAAASQGWKEWVGDGGDVIGIDRFGASAPANEIFQHYGFTVEAVVERAKRMLRRRTH